MSKNNIVTFSTDDFVNEIKDVMLETRYRSYPVVDANNKVIGSISRYHLISQNKKKVILMDHNEKSQSVHGLEDAEVLEIVDHHRIADIQTGSPIYFRNEPVGSTSTIVASIFFENGIRPTKSIAGILCGAIISDTLLLKSPTSTRTDELMLNRLAKIANIDLEKFAKEMFRAGTSIKNKTAEEILMQDFKLFTFNDFKIGISQVTTMDIESFRDKKADLLELMNTKANNENLSIVILMITDILSGGSKLICTGSKTEFVEHAFNITLENNCVFLPDVVSRKKQIVPPLNATISKLGNA
jgi:manganese-dependent inorganic pyrophosphatase